VLDDTAGEGKEVRKFNPWLSYGEVLHRVREFGCAPKVFDFLDERPLHVGEAAEVVKLICGDIAADWPHPEVTTRGEREKGVMYVMCAVLHCVYMCVCRVYTYRIAVLFTF
jgi:hypothetical protein